MRLLKIVPVVLFASALTFILPVALADPISNPPIATCPTMTIGATEHTCVRILQAHLNSHGANIDIDGIFGPLTAQAVRAYQASHNLAVDGIAGTQVLGSLASNAASSSPAQSAPLGKAASGERCEGRAEAQQIAASGRFAEPFAPVESTSSQASPGLLSGDHYPAKIVLRYSEERQCVWALITLDRKWRSDILHEIEAPAAWLDVSRDKGRTVSLGKVNERLVHPGNSSTYTALWSTRPINSDRTP
ncbi:peptidoglycan-binding domain-containing protein [Streptomyces erythrochromogenes]|uniref:peptidoglycan-binding domain-containing protein n=1 Tax=Streptomyces erythrochromogenes TaxID=285574 RepID=UPI0036F7AA4C